MWWSKGYEVSSRCTKPSLLNMALIIIITLTCGVVPWYYTSVLLLEIVRRVVPRCPVSTADMMRHRLRLGFLGSLEHLLDLCISPGLTYWQKKK